MATIDPDRRYFNEHIAHTAVAKSYLYWWREQQSAVNQVRIAIAHGTPSEIAMARAFYISASDRCSKLLGTLNTRFNWPAY